MKNTPTKATLELKKKRFYRWHFVTIVWHSTKIIASYFVKNA